MREQPNLPEAGRDQTVLCIYCGRRGSRSFHAVSSRDAEYVDQWACSNRSACDRRQASRSDESRTGQ